MDGESERIEGLVGCVVTPLLEHPDDLSLNTTEEADGTIVVEVTVNEEDTGKVIGRQGRVIKSIRTLARAAAARSDRRVEVEIVE